MNYDNGGLSAADVALIQGRNNNDGFGFGGDGAWLVILFLLFGLGGWNNGGGFGGGFGGGSANEYAWLSNGQKEIMQNTNQGFDTLQLQNGLNNINSGVQNLSTQLCNCCADMSQNMCNGFAGVNQTINSGLANAETAANARQIANMQQAFNSEIATLNGFNSLNTNISNCCCDIREGIAGVNYNNAIQTQQLSSQIATENCADRAALQEGIRDLLTNQTANTQRILDQLCADKIDAKNDTIAQLRQELLYSRGQASQVAQTAEIRTNNATVANQLVAELRSCPIPAQPVYGNQPIFTCNGNSGCGCNGNF